MSHALILEDNMIIGRAIQDRLKSLGFDSVDLAWTEDQALEVSMHRSPDLLVVGDAIVGGCPLDVAQQIAAQQNTPVLLITADRCRIERQLPEGAIVSGPFHLSEIEAAVSLACTPHAIAA